MKYPNSGMDYAYDLKDPFAQLTRESFLESPGISTRLPVVSQLDNQCSTREIWELF